MSNPANRYNWDAIPMSMRLDYTEKVSGFLAKLGFYTPELHAKVLEEVARLKALEKASESE